MKIVFQNPQLTSDAMRSGSGFPGLHDYAVHFLRQFRPAIRITPTKRWVRWVQFCRMKKLPLTGWDYVFTESGLRNYDLLLSLTGNGAMSVDPLPRGFTGMKVHHVMDYSFRAKEAGALLRQGKVDFLLGYSSHDRWCGFFQAMFPDYTGRVLPLPFGLSERFCCTTPFAERVPKVAAMGAVNPVRDPLSDPRSITAYVEFFKDQEWAHPMRAAVRANLDRLADIVQNFMAVPPSMRNLAYDSVMELNRHKLFVNDDSIMHYPPARTYEGVACGAVMVCSDHPVYREFGWHGGENCLTHRFANLDDFAATVRAALADLGGLATIQRASLTNAGRFSHAKIAQGLHAILGLLWQGKVEAARHYWVAAERAVTPRSEASDPI